MARLCCCCCCWSLIAYTHYYLFCLFSILFICGLLCHISMYDTVLGLSLITNLNLILYILKNKSSSLASSSKHSPSSSLSPLLFIPPPQPTPAGNTRASTKLPFLLAPLSCIYHVLIEKIQENNAHFITFIASADKARLTH